MTVLVALRLLLERDSAVKDPGPAYRETDERVPTSVRRALAKIHCNIRGWELQGAACFVGLVMSHTCFLALD